MNRAKAQNCDGYATIYAIFSTYKVNVMFFNKNCLKIL